MNTSSPERSALRWIIFSALSMVIVVILVLAYKHIVAPKIEEDREAEAAEREASEKEVAVLREVAAKEAARLERFRSDAVRISDDPFAGLAVIRSALFREGLTKQNIHLVLETVADYKARLQAIDAGDLHMGAFTIDAELIVGAQLKHFPNVAILFVIDESKGADGIVAYKSAVPNVQALNNAGAKIVLTPDSPSDTLTRHMISGMLPSLSGDTWLVPATGADDVYRQLRNGNKDQVRAYVLWEPTLSRALEDPNVHLIYDSSNVSGMLVDVLLVNRDYLKAEPIKCRQVTETYFTALLAYTSKPDGMINLLLEDGRQMGDIISLEQAKRMVGKIQWKNTMENYAHFGLLPASESQGLPRIDTMVSSIVRLLLKTGKLSSHPMAEREQEMYSTEILGAMRKENFHPGGTIVRGIKELGLLTPEQWNMLIMVGNMDARAINFVRAQAELTVQSKRDVQEIVEGLRDWPNYYLKVVGHARPEGDPAANLALAQARAKSVRDRIVQLGVNPNRVRAEADISENEAAGQSVTFMLLRQPY